MTYKVGNDLWWSQVSAIHETMPKGTHFKEAEIELFYRLYSRMREDGMNQEQIRSHFVTTFNIRYGAFYTRLRKVWCRHVL